jgi:hypothetical protein
MLAEIHPFMGGETPTLVCPPFDAIPEPHAVMENPTTKVEPVKAVELRER